MKPFTLILLLIPLLLLSGACKRDREPIVLDLCVDWKFTPGDHPDYRLPEFDDTGWRTIRIDDTWDHQGFHEMLGFAWYRLTLSIPGDMIKESFLSDSIRFRMGKIDDYDQVFLNGYLIGQNCRVMPPGSSVGENFYNQRSPWWIQRSYTLSLDDPRIIWDSLNTLAVRVYNSGGPGGMFGGIQQVAMADLSDYLSADYQRVPFQYLGDQIEKKFFLKNTSKFLQVEGQFRTITAAVLTGAVLNRDRMRVKLAPGDSVEIACSLPVPHEPVCLCYQFRQKGSGHMVEMRENTPYLLTPLPGPAPRINGPEVTGVRPEHPFLFYIPVTGRRPVTYKADLLPDGLTLDEKTGIISGTPDEPGEYRVTLKASNDDGSDTSTLRIIVGNDICLTPPMGWNSWNCWGLDVDQGKVLECASEFRRNGLADHGWNYINMDDGWEIPYDSQVRKRSAGGTILTNEKFPDIKALADSIHSLGLKIGIYSSPGPFTCGGFTASYGHESRDASTYGDWAIDYLKYDWCSYGRIAKDHSRQELMRPYQKMRRALDRVHRDIVYSLCQYGMGEVWEWGATVGGNLWRTTGDIVDTWESMSRIGFKQTDNAPYAAPGHWNDPDMLVVGWVGWGLQQHPSRLTPDEQYTHISLWCLLSAPLLLGCNPVMMDPFTLNLLTNDEVLAVNQDPLGKQALRMIKDDPVQVWMKELEDGRHAAGIFNLGDNVTEYPMDLTRLGFTGGVLVRDLWRQKDLGEFPGTFTAVVPSHGVLFVALTGNRPR
ncbi:MAG: putative Ig domain-containing protein [Bacteroidales bacterium]|nr:putative Ig domain-containing protein [Bacteroidales bacterium]